MGIAALVLQLDEILDVSKTIVERVFDDDTEHLDAEQVEAKLAGIVGDVNLKAARFSKIFSLQEAETAEKVEILAKPSRDASEIIAQINSNRADDRVDPQSIDIGDELRAGIEKKVQTWKDEQRGKLDPGEQSSDSPQQMYNQTFAAAKINWQADRLRETMTGQVQEAIARDMNTGKLQKDAFARLSDLKEEAQNYAKTSPQAPTR